MSSFARSDTSPTSNGHRGPASNVTHLTPELDGAQPGRTLTVVLGYVLGAASFMLFVLLGLNFRSLPLESTPTAIITLGGDLLTAAGTAANDGTGTALQGSLLSLRTDGLGTLLALLVTGVGSIVLASAGHYLAAQPRPRRFILSLMALVLSTLGLVLAEDLRLLLVFWILTGIISVLLIRHPRTRQARRGAIQTLLVTGLSSLCLLGAVTLIFQSTGTTSLTHLAEHPGVLGHASHLRLIVGLLLAAALTMTAQFPFHFWLRNAIAAPTPAAALLFTCTTANAGLYLLLRFEPILNDGSLWTTTLALTGGITMLLGAYQGLKQYDLKALLAYSALAKLGVLTLLLAFGGEAGRAACVAGILAYGTCRGSLFLAAGAVEHAAGTRDVRKLGGLGRVMPMTAVHSLVACLSMAALPPTLGFAAMEKLLELGHEHGLVIFIALVVTGALLFAQAARFWIRTFAGSLQSGLVDVDPPEPGYSRYKPPADPHVVMQTAIALPAFAGILLAFFGRLFPLYAYAANLNFPDTQLWLYPFHDISVTFVFSLLVISLGINLVTLHRHVSMVQEKLTWDALLGRGPKNPTT
jgi:multicomponent Na+:H+ antiporter subunit A